MTLFLLAAMATALSLCTEFRLSVGPLHVTPAEIFALCAIVLALPHRRPGASSVAIWLLGVLVVSSLLAMGVASYDEPTVTAARNLLIPAGFLAALSNSRLSVDQAATVLLAFVVGVAACSLLALAQAMVGSPPVPSLYTLGAVSGVSRIDIMSWKLSLAQSTKVLPLQRSLGFGLNTFSNNFGELVVYALAATLTLWRVDKIRVGVAATLTVLFALALASSLSRTAWLGAALVLLLFAVTSGRTALHRIAAIGAVIVGGAISASPFLAAISFDRGGTVGGRMALDGIGMTVFERADTMHLLLGGSGLAYWSYAGAFSAPHSSALYMLLNFGIIGLVLTILVFMAVALALVAAGRRGDGRAKGLAMGAAAATTWFGLYSLTWANLASALSILEWAIIIGPVMAALAANPEPARRRATAKASSARAARAV